MTSNEEKLTSLRSTLNELSSFRLPYKRQPEEADAAKERLLAFNAKWVGKRT